MLDKLLHLVLHIHSHIYYGLQGVWVGLGHDQDVGVVIIDSLVLSLVSLLHSGKVEMLARHPWCSYHALRALGYNICATSANVATICLYYHQGSILLANRGGGIHSILTGRTSQRGAHLHKKVALSPQFGLFYHRMLQRHSCDSPHRPV